MNSANFNGILNCAEQFRVYTGDITSGYGMRHRKFSDPTAELLECLKIQLEKWSSEEKRMCQEDDFLSLRTSFACCAPNPLVAENANLNKFEISVKLFLSQPDDRVIEQCYRAVCRELNVNTVNQLIVALPPLDSTESTDNLTSQFVSVWPTLEEMVAKGQIHEIGVADLEHEDLAALIDQLSGRVRPKINHCNVACCPPSPDLIQLAANNNINLLAHSDPHPFLTTAQVQELLVSYLKIPEATAKNWKATFACRYTVMEKCTSVIAFKGYLVHFKKPNCA